MEIVLLPNGSVKQHYQISAWYKKEGDLVKVDEILAKASLEEDQETPDLLIKSPINGMLRKILFPDRKSLPSATPIALIGKTPEFLDTIKIFYSYAKTQIDEQLRENLEAHLSSLRRQNFIDDLYGSEITAGTEWKESIYNHLNTAHIILLLISPDFIRSDFCYGIEMQRALERHEAKEARVIPILLRPTDWQGAPFAKIQGLPKDWKPVTSWSSTDAAFLDITRGIRQAIKELFENYSLIVKDHLRAVQEKVFTYNHLASKISAKIKQSDGGRGQLIQKKMEEIERLQQQILILQKEVSNLKYEQEVFQTSISNLYTEQEAIFALRDAILGEGYLLRTEERKLKKLLEKLES